MKLKFFFIFFLFSFSQIFSSQAIEWSPDRKLNFKDFAGNIPTYNDSGAESKVGISYKILSNSIWTGRIKIKIFAVFYPEESWFDKKYILSNDLLNHEQRHFDIAHIFANKIQKIIDNQIKGTKDFNNNFQKLFNENYNEHNDFQFKYDLETNHGNNLEVQNKYNDIISKMIDN